MKKARCYGLFFVFSYQLSHSVQGKMMIWTAKHEKGTKRPWVLTFSGIDSQDLHPIRLLMLSSFGTEWIPEWVSMGFEDGTL
jgi:hypothetical protein